MSQLDPQVLNDQMRAFGEGICDPSIPRNAHGYQGRVRFKRNVPGVVVEALDGPESGQEFIIDPTEFAEHGDVFARQYVTMGRKSGSSFGDFVAKLIPFALAAGAGGPASIGVDVLKGLFGKVLVLLLYLALVSAAVAADTVAWLKLSGLVSH